MMKKWMMLVCSMLLVGVLAACGNQVDEETANNYIKKAEEVVQQLNAGEFEKIITQFDEKMAANVTAAQLAEITPVLEASGNYEGLEKQSVEEKDGNKIVVLVGKHSTENRIYTVSFNANDEIAGLFVQ